MCVRERDTGRDRQTEERQTDRQKREIQTDKESDSERVRQSSILNDRKEKESEKERERKRDKDMSYYYQNLGWDRTPVKATVGNPVKKKWVGYAYIKGLCYTTFKMGDCN